MRVTKQVASNMLVLPELFLGGYNLEGIAARALALEGQELLCASDIARQNRLALVFGFPEAALGPQGMPQVYNTVVAIDSTGVRRAVYRKTHLFGAKEKAAFNPGSCLGEVFQLAGLSVGLLICYDVEFPEAVRTLALNGAELILVPTANYTPYDYINENLVPCRAYDNQVHVVYANWAHDVPGGESFNGRSVLAGPQAQLLLHFGACERGLKVAAVQVRATGPAEGLEDDYLHDRRPKLYHNVTATQGRVHANSGAKLLIINGVTGALGNALFGQAVQSQDVIVYGLSRQALPWRQMLLHGSMKLPHSTLLTSLGKNIEDEDSIRGFLGAINFSHFSSVWYCHAVGIMPFEVDEQGRHAVSNDDDNDGIDDRVMKLTGLAFLRMARALAQATSAPVAVLSFGALSDVWGVSAHKSGIEAIKVAKAGLNEAFRMYEHLSGGVLNISSVACAHEILTRPFVCAQVNAKLNYWLTPWEVAAKCIDIFKDAKRGTLLEEDFFRPLPTFNAAAYYEDTRFTRQKMLELYISKPEDVSETNGNAQHSPVATVDDTIAYYELAKVQENYHTCWGQNNMHIGLFPQVF